MKLFVVATALSCGFVAASPRHNGRQVQGYNATTTAVYAIGTGTGTGGANCTSHGNVTLWDAAATSRPANDTECDCTALSTTTMYVFAPDDASFWPTVDTAKPTVTTPTNIYSFDIVNETTSWKDDRTPPAGVPIVSFGSATVWVTSEANSTTAITLTTTSRRTLTTTISSGSLSRTETIVVTETIPTTIHMPAPTPTAISTAPSTILGGFTDSVFTTVTMIASAPTNVPATTSVESPEVSGTAVTLISTVVNGGIVSTITEKGETIVVTSSRTINVSGTAVVSAGSPSEETVYITSSRQFTITGTGPTTTPILVNKTQVGASTGVPASIIETGDSEATITITSSRNLTVTGVRPTTTRTFVNGTQITEFASGSIPASSANTLEETVVITSSRNLTVTGTGPTTTRTFVNGTQITESATGPASSSSASISTTRNISVTGGVGTISATLTSPADVSVTASSPPQTVVTGWGFNSTSSLLLGTGTGGVDTVSVSSTSPLGVSVTSTSSQLTVTIEWGFNSTSSLPLGTGITDSSSPLPSPTTIANGTADSNSSQPTTVSVSGSSSTITLGSVTGTTGSTIGGWGFNSTSSLPLGTGITSSSLPVTTLSATVNGTADSASPQPTTVNGPSSNTTSTPGPVVGTTSASTTGGWGFNSTSVPAWGSGSTGGSIVPSSSTPISSSGSTDAAIDATTFPSLSLSSSAGVTFSGAGSGTTAATGGGPSSSAVPGSTSTPCETITTVQGPSATVTTTVYGPGASSPTVSSAVNSTLANPVFASSPAVTSTVGDFTVTGIVSVAAYGSTNSTKGPCTVSGSHTHSTDGSPVATGGSNITASSPSLSTLITSTRSINSGVLPPWSNIFSSSSSPAATYAAPASSQSTLPSNITNNGTVDCSETGGFTISWDDQPLYIQDTPEDAPYAPVFNPYHHLFFANGFAYYAPDHSLTHPGTYDPISGPNVAIYKVDPTVSIDDRDDRVGNMLPGQIGAGPRVEDRTYWFDAFGAELGCDNGGSSPCNMTISGYTYNPVHQNEYKTSEQFAAIPPCNQLEDCVLTHVDFDNDFRGLSSIRFEAVVDGATLKSWVIDNLNVAWYDNSCEAGRKRRTVKKK